MTRFVEKGLWLAAVCGAACIQSAAGADWYTWRGPATNGMSQEKGWNPNAIVNPTVAWTAQVGEGYSAVAVKGERLYTMGNNDGNDSVVCLNAKTGKEYWRHSYPCKKGSYPGTRATPLVVDDRVYTLSREGHLFCLAAMNGDVIWKKNVAAETGAELLGWGFASSPILVDDLLLLNIGKSGMAVKAKTGEIAWHSGGGKASFASVIPYKHGGTLLAAVFGSKELYGVAFADGKVQWSVPWETSWDVNAADPIVSGDELFIASGYGRGCALFKLGAGTPAKVWENKAICAHFTTPILLDGYLYGLDGNTGKDGAVKCVEWKSGKEKWSKMTGFGSLSMADGKLIVINERGHLAVMEAVPDGCKILAEGKVPAQSSKGEKWWTMPILSNGLLYCRNSGGTLVAIDLAR
jgi:outer membrane protein assembly factor BamB